MNLFQLQPHEFAQIFPNESGDKFTELVVSIRKLGRLRFPVIVFEGKILDGNQRIRACKIAKVEPRHIEFKGSRLEALDLVWDLNWNRRQLNVSQKAFYFAQYCAFANSGNPVAQGSPGVPLTVAAKKAGVSKNTMRRAKKVAEYGTEEQKESVRTGKATVKSVASSITQSQSKNSATDVDASGCAVPKPAQEYWHRRKEAADILAQLRYAKTKIRALKPEDIMWAEVNLGGVTSDLESAINRFRGGMPEYVCAHCEGKHPKGCQACKGRGVVSAYFWKQCVPDEMKEQRKKNASGS